MKNSVREPLINCLRERIAALSGAQKLAYLIDMLCFLRSVRLTLHLARLLNQRYLRFFAVVLMGGLSVWSYANCEQQSTALVQSLEIEVFGKLTEHQRLKATEVARIQCEQQAKNTDKTGTGDFFTDYLLSGEHVDKPGNKRLKRKN